MACKSKGEGNPEKIAYEFTKQNPVEFIRLWTMTSLWALGCVYLIWSQVASTTQCLGRSFGIIGQRS